jgi:hypothetical protein
MSMVTLFLTGNVLTEAVCDIPESPRALYATVF